MKNLLKFTWLFILPLFIACSEEEGRIKNLKLSVPLMEEESIITENVDFEFEILDGNGGYMASVSEFDGDEDAIVTIVGE